MELVSGRPYNWRETGTQPWVPVCANMCKYPYPYVKTEGDLCKSCSKIEGAGTKVMALQRTEASSDGQ